MSFLKLSAIGAALLVVVGCSDKRFTESKSFAGVTTEERHTVSAETLNLGYGSSSLAASLPASFLTTKTLSDL